MKRYSLRGLRRLLPQLGVVPVVPYQALTARLAEGETEIDARRRGCQRLIDVLDRLYEVALPEDEVAVLRGLHVYYLELHD
jgi:hypothetical protein